MLLIQLGFEGRSFVPIPTPNSFELPNIGPMQPILGSAEIEVVQILCRQQ